jgi:hypothetical protein
VLAGRPDPIKDPTWMLACARAAEAIQQRQARLNPSQASAKRRGDFSSGTLGISMGTGLTVRHVLCLLLA